MKAAQSGDSESSDATCVIQDFHGAQRHFAISRRAINTLAGRLTLATFHDVTESTLREDELSELAFKDKLTGLANRVAFHAQMTAMGARAVSEPFGILIVDLDGFKLVNDSLGHHAGDEMLSRVAQRIQPLLRMDDLAARIGGEEFAILVASGEVQASVRVADHILKALSEPFEIDGAQARVGASIGIALCPAHAADPAQAMKYADAAMYAAKKHKPAYAVHGDGGTAVTRTAACPPARVDKTAAKPSEFIERGGINERRNQHDHAGSTGYQAEIHLARHAGEPRSREDPEVL